MAAEARVKQPIAALLPQYGLSVESLARAVGVDDSAVLRVLEGSYLPTPDFASRVARYLGAREDELFLPERRAGKHHAKPCRGCGERFNPTGPNNGFCIPCRAKRARRSR